jgi:hypothetical protein
MPFDDEEHSKKINRGGVNATRKRRIENKYLELSELALAEVETQLTEGSDEGIRFRAAKKVLDEVSSIYKQKDMKLVANKKIKSKAKEDDPKVNSMGKVPLVGVPVVKLRAED